ncbi:MAG: Holliday junction branch migration protein RuvA [Minisyncoccia bacterium]
MIGRLKGEIVETDIKHVILDVSGVGYKIYTNAPTLQIKLGMEAEFWTYLAVRENALDLYGFQSKDELHFFELLITVSGIGPKSALGILSVSSLNSLRQAITSGDVSILTKVSGIGKKNAEKIVIELRDKLEKDEFDTSPSASMDVDALEALKALGYSEREAREALKKVVESRDTSDKVKKALKILS